MYKLCKPEQSAQRQRQLEQGLLQAMLEYRYEDISVSDLCDLLQVPRKSFYRYFSGKDGALYALLDHTMMEFFHTGIGAEGMMTWGRNGDLNRYFLFWRQHGVLLDALQRNGLSGILVERAMDLSLREGLMPGKLRKLQPQSRQLAMTFTVCGLMSMVLRWHEQGFQMSPEEMAEIAVSILTEPLIQ